MKTILFWTDIELLSVGLFMDRLLTTTFTTSISFVANLRNLISHFDGSVDVELFAATLTVLLLSSSAGIFVVVVVVVVDGATVVEVVVVLVEVVVVVVVLVVEVVVVDRVVDDGAADLAVLGL